MKITLAGQISDVFTKNGPKLGILGGLTDLFGMFWSMILALILLTGMLSVGWIGLKLGYSALSDKSSYNLTKAGEQIKAPVIGIVLVLSIVGIATAFIGKY